MISLNDIKDALYSGYIVDNTYMEEKREGMKIDIDYPGEYILFQSDKKGAKYLDCFSPTLKGINRKADYIIITLKRDTIHCVIVELKKTDDPREQLIHTEHFAEFIFKRICYKYKKTPNIVIRKIGAFKDEFPKGLRSKGFTKPGKIYNNDGFAYIKGNKFNLGSYL
jgi:hypothetical protein